MFIVFSALVGLLSEDEREEVALPMLSLLFDDVLPLLLLQLTMRVL